MTESSISSEASLRFGPFELRADGSRLHKQGAPLDVQPKVLDLIAHLVRRRGELVSRDELLDAVWPAVFVSDDALFQTLRKARRALDDNARRPVWIETVPGRGYRFIGQVSVEVPEAPVEPAPYRLIGRAAALEALERLWEDGVRRVVLLGPGGIGKTRLAIEHARLSHGRWTSTAWVDLTATTTVDALVGALAGALGVSLDPMSSEAAVAQVGRALAHRGACLVVLDNLERVLPDAEVPLEALAAAAPDARWLVTTRVRPELGEQGVIDVGPLPIAHGRQLFLERALQAGARIVPRWYADVDALVAALDGLPLAIELASARATLLDPRALLARLAERLDLLAGSADRPPRHQSLRAMIAWSWDPLTADERATLSRVALFEGAFTVEQAEALLGDDRACALDALDALQRYSLVEPRHAHVRPVLGRLRLARSVREYALEQLGPADDARARLVGCLLRLEESAARVAERDDDDSGRALAEDLDNLRGAIEVAEAREDVSGAARLARCLGIALSFHGRGFEIPSLVRRFCTDPRVPGPVRVDLQILVNKAERDERAVDHLDLDALVALAERFVEEDPDVVARALVHASQSLGMRGDFDRSVAAARAAVARARRTGTELSAWYAAATSRVRQGRAVEAEALALEGLSRCPLEGHEAMQIGLLDNRARALVLSGRPGDAITIYEELLPRTAARANRRMEVTVAGNLGSLLQEVGRFEEALVVQDRTVEISRRIDPSPSRLAGNLHNRALTRLHLDDLLGAERDLVESLACAADSRGMLVAFTHMNFAALAALSRRYASCLDHAERALAAMAVTPDMVRAGVLLWRVVGRAALGDHAAARADLAFVEALPCSGVPDFLRDAFVPLARLLDALDPPPDDRGPAEAPDLSNPLVRLVDRAAERVLDRSTPAGR